MNGPEFLFDTNLVIGHLKGRLDARAMISRNGAVPASTAVSQITRMELLGFRSITMLEEARINEFLVSIHVLLLDERTEAAAIALRRRTRLRMPDAIIAATAQVHALRLLTFDDTLRKAAVALGVGERTPEQ